MTNSSTSIHHFGTVVSDLDEAMDFYATHLGFTIQSTSEWMEAPGTPLGFNAEDVRLRVGLMCLGASVIEFLQFDKGPQAQDTTGPAPGTGHLAIAVTDIHSTYQALSTSGVRFYSQPQELDAEDGKSDWWVYGQDPFGTIIELYQTG